MAENIQQKMMEFERNRNQLMGVSTQKQQLQIQSETLKLTAEELDKTKEKQVYKAVGNILILSDMPKVRQETKDKIESVNLRLKTMQKQEESLINSLNKLKSEIEAAQGGAAPADSQVLETEGKDKKK